MISIVAHGIMGTSYRQDVVVDSGSSTSANLQVLRDIRRQLSSQYGDEIPMTGWALVPAPDGRWLSRIERAFDANYAPAYVAVSFLIPHGRRLCSEASQLIEYSLIANHDKYMQQSVVLYDADWSFLIDLGRKMETMVEHAPSTTYRVTSSQNIAYWSGDIRSMIDHIWDERFDGYSIIYCGKRILASGKEFARIDDKEVNKPETPPDVNQETTTAAIHLDVNELRVHPFEDGDELLKSHKEVIKLGYPNHDRSSKKHNEISKQKVKPKKVMRRVLWAVSVASAVFVVVLGGMMILGNDNNTDDTSSVNVEKPNKGSEAMVVLKDSTSSNTAPHLTDDDEVQSRKKNERTSQPKEPVSMSTTDIESTHRGKIKISSSGMLFRRLTWENVKNGRAYFYEKYEVDIRYRKRVDFIIRTAQKMGPRYRMIYSKVDHQREDNHDKLRILEREIDIFRCTNPTGQNNNE